MLHHLQRHQCWSVLVEDEYVPEVHLDQRKIASNAVDLAFRGWYVSAILGDGEGVLDEGALAVVMEYFILEEELGVLLKIEYPGEDSSVEPVLDLEGAWEVGWCELVELLFHLLFGPALGEGEVLIVWVDAEVLSYNVVEVVEHCWNGLYLVRVNIYFLLVRILNLLLVILLVRILLLLFYFINNSLWLFFLLGYVGELFFQLWLEFITDQVEWLAQLFKGVLFELDSGFVLIQLLGEEGHVVKSLVSNDILHWGVDGVILFTQHLLVQPQLLMVKHQLLGLLLDLVGKHVQHSLEFELHFLLLLFLGLGDCAGIYCALGSRLLLPLVTRALRLSLRRLWLLLCVCLFSLIFNL
jgi:hypothetical protein